VLAAKFATGGATVVRFPFWSFAALAAVVIVTPADAQTRKPTAKEIARHSRLRYPEQCLFKLVADPCIGEPGSAPDAVTADCYRIEGEIWDALLNENYKSLLGGLDSEQAAKARAMQRAWVAYRDTTCGFYDDKIRGSMSNVMHAACHTRETARRAMLLDFFSGL
jgi:uncharacterized protein YecT (DUF1311 family)